MRKPFSIETVNLTKRYGGFCALNDVCLQVRRGEVFGFLGPNGAGKTTTIRILMGIGVPTSGHATVLGLDSMKERAELKRSIGYLPDTPTFYDYLRGSEFMHFVGRMHGLSPQTILAREEKLFDQMKLKDAQHEYVSNYSMGMKKKLALALALIHEPSILILDEPTTGLDPLASRDIRKLIRQLADEGRTVFLSTHLLNMAEELCDRVGIIHRGSLLEVDTPAELKASQAKGGSLEEVFLDLTADEEQ